MPIIRMLRTGTEEDFGTLKHPLRERLEERLRLPRRSPREPRYEPPDGKWAWVTGWAAALITFAIVVGLFLVLALAICTRDHPWKDLEGVTSLSITNSDACAVQADRSVACWDWERPSNGLTSPVKGEFLALSISGGRHFFRVPRLRGKA